MCYNLPVLERLLADPQAKALYLFPTKALAQDQLGTLRRWAEAEPAVAAALRPATYDGDTPQHSRRKIRTEANVILSNPDMLHVGILPYHPRWASFFQDLRYVVVDELHHYRGIFGSNVAMVMRRLARVCGHYGAGRSSSPPAPPSPTPARWPRRLTGRPCEPIDDRRQPARAAPVRPLEPAAAGPGRPRAPQRRHGGHGPPVPPRRAAASRRSSLRRRASWPNWCTATPARNS